MDTTFAFDNNHNKILTLSENDINLLIQSSISSVVSLWVGLIAWWSETSATIPSGWVISDGRAINRTQYSLLFNKIGTRYGEGDGSTTFNVPNLILTADSNNNGNFIRATNDDASVGAKVKDEIREIAGTVGLQGVEYANGTEYGDTGCFVTGSWTYDGKSYGGGHSGDRKATNLTFGSNRNRSSANPMAGHGDGADIHPYYISLIPIIFTGAI